MSEQDGMWRIPRPEELRQPEPGENVEYHMTQWGPSLNKRWEEYISVSSDGRAFWDPVKLFPDLDRRTAFLKDVEAREKRESDLTLFQFGQKYPEWGAILDSPPADLILKGGAMGHGVY